MPTDQENQRRRPVPAVLDRARARVVRALRPRTPAIPPRSAVSAAAADPGSNIAWNQRRWGDAAQWRALDSLGYQWGGGVAQTPATVAKLADKFLRPYVGNRYQLAILEISPGGGRMTAELVRYAKRLSLVDLNAAAIDICRERFSMLPIPIEYVVNDGRSLAGVSGGPFDLIACYDSMVHMHPDVVRGYVVQMPALLVEGGTAWLDHSGKGQTNRGARTAMTAELMVEFAAGAGLTVADQLFRNDWDCISVLRKP